MKALSIAATGMMAQQTNVDVISNNIANANTTGFKSSRAAFQDLIYQSMQREGALTSGAGNSRPLGIDIGLGVQTAGTVRLNTQGGMLATENSLNVAIDGRGYFSVQMPDGSTAYTRDGSFQLSAEGEIVTMQGYQVDPGLVVPQNTTSVEINEQGLVMAYVENDPNPVELGQLNIATFINEPGMRPVGNNFLLATDASGEAQAVNPGDPGAGLIRQGYLEASNVNVIQQITDLISAQRAYEMNSKSIETADQMLSSANQNPLMRLIAALLLTLASLASPALAASVEVLVEERARSDYGTELPDAGEFEITLQAAPQDEVLTLAEFWMDVPSGKFMANAVLASGNVQRIGGLALITVPVPVPTRRLMPDEIVGEADVTLARLPVGRVGAYVLTDARQVVGKQVRRVLSPGRPIQSASIIRPLVIERGDLVEIRFSDGQLALSSPGRALGDAHEGQDIRIVNLISNKTVTATATGDKTVEILR